MRKSMARRWTSLFLEMRPVSLCKKKVRHNQMVLFAMRMSSLQHKWFVFKAFVKGKQEPYNHLPASW